MRREQSRRLVWDHARGYRVLDALDARGGAGALDPPAVWRRQPLEDFEARPLRTLVDDYDLLVVDHPGLGEAVADGALTPLDTVFPAAEIAAWRGRSMGASFRSYHLDGHQWAVPLDAAAQISVVRPGRAGERPATWEEAVALGRRVDTALCLGGPHALLMFSAVCVALGDPPATAGDALVPRGTAREALALIAELLGHADQDLSRGNPIAVLDALAAGRAAYCPLVFGYVTYSMGADPLDAFDAPGFGSVLGGTGLALSRRCDNVPAARAHVRRLLSSEVQQGLYAELGGQSAMTASWHDPTVNAGCNGFYLRTARTLDAAWIRPRFAGYTVFQRDASRLLREGLYEGTRHDILLDLLDDRFRASAPAVRS